MSTPWNVFFLSLSQTLNSSHKLSQKIPSRKAHQELKIITLSYVVEGEIELSERVSFNRHTKKEGNRKKERE